MAMRERLPLLELLLSALCLWAGWYHTPAGALVRTAGAWIFGTRSTARPLLAYFAAGTLVPPRPPPPLGGPVPPAQALAYGAAAVLDGSPAELAPRIRALAQRLGSDDAALLALFCGEEAARFAVAEARSSALDDLSRALPPRSEACVARAAQAAMLGGAYALGWPLPESVRITSLFGVRDHPIIGGRRLHAGVDLGASTGTPVHAVAAGVVRRASSDGINGRIVVLDHGRGVVTTYCHNDALLVRNGQHVDKGQTIARSGSTGLTTGAHLHYQIDLAGEPVDPLRFRAQHPKTAMGATD
ncbi:MAG: M23 family metallopeptidase [Deltaproteobacteria bacterium]|nr:MAG: M23 family metallopeptidase [Deltaproteobacteria bacterium]